jgi:serine/threonine-protein kinase
MRCADSRIVAAWISGRLDAQAREALEVHADGCEACLQVLAAVGKVCADPHSRRICDTHGAPVLADWALLDAVLPTAVSRYRMRGVLGRGGFGVVYDAFDCELDRTVAIKALASFAGDHDDALRAEARALAALSHPNVVQVYDVVATHGRVFLVMEQVHGETLRSWQVGRTHARILEHYLAAAAGIVAIHEAGLVHADIKPDNLLVAQGGRVLVTDFGLSRTVAVASEAAADVVLGGTPRYMAPEQATGAVIDARADQYSFCVALSEALHGALPGQRPVRTSPKRLRAVLARGLSEDPAQRWPSMTSLVTALREASAPRARWWPVVVVFAAVTGALPSIGARPAAAIDVAPAIEAPAPAMPAAEASAAIDTAIAQRNAGDLSGAIATLRRVLDGRIPSSPLLATRARHEIGRTLEIVRDHDSRRVLVDAHDAAVAQRADLLAAAISIDLAISEAETPATLDVARGWLRTAEAELLRSGVDVRRHGGLALAAAEIAAIEGETSRATEGFARATELLVGDDPFLRVRAHSRWARLLGDAGQHERGLAKIAEGEALCTSTGLDRSPARIHLHRTAATLLQHLGRFDEAVTQIDRALVLADAITGYPAHGFSELHGDLGVFHLYRNDRDKTEYHLGRAVDLAPGSWAAHNNLSIHFGKLACRTDVETPTCDPDARERAHAHQLRAAELARDAFGEDHPTFATMRANLARSLLERGEIERAHDLYETSCAQLEAHFGAEARQLTQPLYGLLEAKVKLGRRADAATTARKLHTVAHGAALQGRDDLAAVLDYAIGRTLAWTDPRDEGARRMMIEGERFFGETKPDDFRLIATWFPE